ncbi:alpha/beta hydrolase family esterase [Mycobacterium tuberculosis]
MLRRVAILLAAVLAFAGCSGGTRLAAGFGNGNSVHTLDVDGAGRSYRLYKPVGLPSSAPLVVMLHGGFGSAKQAERSYGWDELADSEKFLVAYPDGYHRAWNANGGGCCGRPAREGVDDIGFVRAVVADIANNVSIDPARVYVTGMSNGAIMSYTLACNTSIFAAIGVVSGTQLDPCQSPRPVSVIHIHGTADPLVRYHGGPGAGFARIDGPPVPDLNAFWREVNRCGALDTTTEGPVTTSGATCADNRRVVLLTVDDAGH